MRVIIKKTGYNNYMKKLIIVVLLVAILIMAGCSDTEPEIKGIVTQVNPDSDAILVESQSQLVSGLVWVDIDENTKYKAGVESDFMMGSYVEIIIDGAIAQSYPMQARAKKITINKMQNK